MSDRLAVYVVAIFWDVGIILLQDGNKKRSTRNRYWYAVKHTYYQKSAVNSICLLLERFVTGLSISLPFGCSIKLRLLFLYLIL